MCSFYTKRLLHGLNTLQSQVKFVCSWVVCVLDCCPLVSEWTWAVGQSVAYVGVDLTYDIWSVLSGYYLAVACVGSYSLYHQVCMPVLLTM